MISSGLTLSHIIVSLRMYLARWSSLDRRVAMLVLKMCIFKRIYL